jgi:hypothetical protein
MPTLLVRATRELAPGGGFVVPEDERDRFLAAVPQASVVEVDGNHLTVTTSAEAAAAIDGFLASAAG